MKGLDAMALADHHNKSSDHSFGQTKKARKSSDSLFSTTKPLAEAWMIEAARDTQGGKADKTTADTRTPTSYAGAVKASNQKLTITSLTKQNYSNVAATVAMGPNEAYAMCRWTLTVADPLAPLLINNNNNNMLAII